MRLVWIGEGAIISSVPRRCMCPESDDDETSVVVLEAGTHTSDLQRDVNGSMVGSPASNPSTAMQSDDAREKRVV